MELSKEQLERAALFSVCTSKEHLQAWIKYYLGLDLPDGIVCDDDTRTEPSNSCPMDLVWEIYSKALDGKDPSFSRILAYAARDSAKTLAMSVVETLSIFHLRRSVGHLAAIESQAAKAAGYVEKFLQRPHLKDFVVGNNKRTLEVAWYETKDRKKFISPKEYASAVKNGEQWINSFEKKSYKIEIVIATMSGSNSLHVPLLCLDEKELIPPRVASEAMMIPSMGENKELPIVFMTSSRKFASGPVQNEIDNAHETGTLIRHWNYIDVTEPCPPERHLPNEPKIEIFYNEDTLRAVSKQDFDLLSDKEKEKWLVGEGFAGCLKNCALYAACRSRLATKQKSKSKMLKNIHLTANQFKTFAKEPAIAKAQLLCWTPETGSLIFGRLNRSTHLKTAAQIAEIATGDPHPEIRTRDQLFQLFKSLGARIAAGMDFGFTHNFSVIIAAIYGNKAYIFQAFELTGLEIMEKLEVCESLLRPYNPIIHPDQAYPSDIKTWRKSGYQLTNFKKDVQLGIDSARSKISPTSQDEPEMYFLDDTNEDGRVENAFKKICRYEYELDANGIPTDQPKDDDGDMASAFRYLCQQEFGKHLGKTHKPREDRRVELKQSGQNWMQGEITKAIGEGGGVQPVQIKKGKFFFGSS